MNRREQQIGKAYRTLHQFSACGCNPDDGDEHPMDRHIATEIVDALLPQVSTVEELMALPDTALLVNCVGYALRARMWGPDDLPLTVVWQP